MLRWFPLTQFPFRAFVLYTHYPFGLALELDQDGKTGLLRRELLLPASLTHRTPSPPSLPPPSLLLPASPAQGANGELKLLSRDEIAASFEQDHANTIIDSGSPASASHLAAPTSCHDPSKCIVNGHIDRSCRAWASEAIVIAGTSA